MKRLLLESDTERVSPRVGKLMLSNEQSGSGITSLEDLMPDMHVPLLL